jgi:hypothetical protein
MTEEDQALLEKLLAGETVELTFERKAVYGTCPICHAPPRQACHSLVGLQLGVHPDGSRMQDGEGAHLERLQDAPHRVRLEPID